MVDSFVGSMVGCLLGWFGWLVDLYGWEEVLRTVVDLFGGSMAGV